MRYEFTNAVLFSKHGDQQLLASLGSRAIVILSALWSGAPRNPWVNGYLRTVSAAIRPEEFATYTGYKISRFGGDQCIAIVGERYELPESQRGNGRRFGRKRPDVPALCTGKKPVFAMFDQAGYDSGRLFALALAVAAELAASGYCGGINCYSDCIDNNEFENPERCAIDISDGLLTIRVHWGDEVLVGPLLDFCRAEKFTEEEGWEEYEKPRKTA